MAVIVLGAPGGLLRAETIYLAVIALICFVIFARTRKIHKLSSHEGIKYFRYTFLFFGISSLLKFLVQGYAMTFFSHGPGPAMLPNIELLSALLIVYTHLLATLFLLYSISWKNLGRWKDRSWVVYLAALVPIALLMLTMQPAVYIISQVFLIAYAIGVIHSRPGKKTQMHIIYDLLLLFWMLNILDTMIPNFLVLWQAGIYLASLALFLFIFAKVNKLLR
jgi:hypothetical protein